MNRFIKLLLLLSLVVLSCTACSDDELYNSGYNYGYEVGYDIGLSEGWESGEELTKRDISIMYEECIDTHEMEDVTAILWCYADKNSGEDISEEDLREAIWKMLEYYDAVEDYHSNIKTKDLLDVMDIYY